LALTYALVFETLLRLYDVHQQLDWSHVTDDLILHYTPTKTGNTSGISVTLSLADCPMVMEELQPILNLGRPASGPIVMNEKTGERYDEDRVRVVFRQDAERAGMPKESWARDLRSSGITEARLYGVDIADLAKVAGHSKAGTTSHVYDRAVLAASKRVAATRTENRKALKTEPCGARV
jgi:integrase